MSTYFITGGSGFLGINLVRHLLARGEIAISYDIAPFEYPEKDIVRAITGDIRDKEALRTAMRGADIVIHAAAALPLYSPEDIRSTDIDGTRHVFEAATELGITRIVHISSTAVYGIPDHHPISEEDPRIGVGDYGNAKIAAEEIAEGYRDAGSCVTIIRPKSFVGPERLGVFALLFDWAADGHDFPMIGNGNNRYQLLDVDDLCEAIYLATTLEPERVNDTFNIGAKDFTTMKEDFQAVLDRADFAKKIRGFPATPVIWALRTLEFLKLSPLYAWVYESASKDSFVSIDKARSKLGWEPRYSNKEALIRSYDWYLEHRSEFQGTSGISHRVPWKQGVLAFFKGFF